MTMFTSLNLKCVSLLSLLTCQLCVALPRECVVCSDFNRKQPTPCALSLDKCGPCLDDFFADDFNGEKCVSLVIVVQPEKRVLGPEGSTVELSCAFNAEVECVWEKDEQLLDIERSSRIAYKTPTGSRRKRKDCGLVIRGLTADEVGQWQCSNKVTSTHRVESITSHLDILQRVSVNPKQFQNLTYGSTVQLDCTFDREVECEWQRKSHSDRNSRTISIENRYKYVHEEKEHPCCTLSIFKFAEEDEGQWTCVGIRSGHRVESTSTELVGYTGSGLYPASTVSPIQSVAEIREVTRIKWITKVQLATREERMVSGQLTTPSTAFKSDVTSGDSNGVTIAVLSAVIVPVVMMMAIGLIVYFLCKRKSKQEKERKNKLATELHNLLPGSDNQTGQPVNSLDPVNCPSRPTSLALKLPEDNGELLETSGNPQSNTNFQNTLNASTAIFPFDNSLQESVSERDVSDKVRYVLLLDLNGNKRNNFLNLVLNYYAQPDVKTAKQNKLRNLLTNFENTNMNNLSNPRILKKDNCVFIHTPPFNDNTDEVQLDRLIKEKLSEVFANYDELSAICLFLDSDWSTKRNNSGIQLFLKFFHKGAKDNVVFILTDELGQMSSPSADILKAINNCQPNYPRGNNVFRFKNSLPALMATTEPNWDQSMAELHKMIKHIKGLTTVSLTDTTLFNEAREMTDYLEKTIEEILVNCKKSLKARTGMDEEGQLSVDKDIRRWRENADELKRYSGRLDKYVRQNAIVLTNGHPVHLRPKVRRQQSVLDKGQAVDGQDERVMAKEVRDIIEAVREKKIGPEDNGQNRLTPR